MYTPADRERVRSAIVARARDDRRITGGALTGSAAAGLEDAWSDIDLAFGVQTAADLAPALEAWTAYMYQAHAAADHVDVASGAWIYRVFLLANTLQVDLAFAPASDFGARGPTFRLLFGAAAEPAHVPPLSAVWLIGYAWLYALHARSSLARDRLWQAEHMVSLMRDHAFALACLRHGVPAREGRGMDRLPAEVRARFEPALVRAVTTDAIASAFRAATGLVLDETRRVDAALAMRIEPVMLALTENWRAGR